MLSGKDIRRLFLGFFEKNGHTIVKSSSLIPNNDPTLLFTNAGMVQFKDVLTGKEERGYRRAASVQRCIRAGGKHNDLEQVGYTARHHTFFEMLGNFSFGDYFKEGAIELAWAFLINSLNLPKERLWITVFRDDDEAYNIWRDRIGIPEDRIVRMGEADNFWSMGETGPCGPCSEIHIDQGDDVGCKRSNCGIECNCDRFLEIWNLVFMQYNRDKDGRLTLLPKQCIDTGMGIERLTAVVQRVKSNYDTDLFVPIIDNLEGIFKKRYKALEKDDISFRVIADHARASCFMIADGILPSNEGRGYVLRRIIRRAARHGRMLGNNEVFLYKTVDPVVDLMEDAYPLLRDKRDFISNIISSEEERFLTTLDYGLNRIGEIIEDVKGKDLKTVSGDALFKLYDTYGFPLDLAHEILRDNGLDVDLEGFNTAMNRQKEAARSSWKGKGKEIGAIYLNLSKDINCEFRGYETLIEDSQIAVILKDEKVVEDASEKDYVGLITYKTPFYAERGGQIGDAGELKTARGDVVAIKDTKSPLPGIIIHEGVVTKGCIRCNDLVTLKVDAVKRRDIALNHSATHLLQSGLRQVLGDHVKQAGSYVGDDRLRFDFTHFSAMTAKEIHRVEEVVNMKIMENILINTNIMKLDKAIEGGATALFGEKYEDDVRVISISDFSKELCGGTHTGYTGDIGLFKIISEGGIAAGVRRIEALTGRHSYTFITEEEAILNDLRDMLKVTASDERQRLQKLMEKNRDMEKEIDSLKSQLLKAKTTDLHESIREVNGVKVLVKRMEEDVDIKSLRQFIDEEKGRIKTGIIVLGAGSVGKVSLVVGVTKDLTSRFSADKMIKELAKIIGGSGGGRPDFAQAGGSKVEELDKALENVFKIINDAKEERQ